MESDGRVGYGSTFSFTLPITTDAKPIRGYPVSSPAVDHDAKCVIIFDDDVTIGQLFKRYLNKHEVMLSQSQNELLHLTQIIQPSAVVLNCNQRNTDFEATLTKCSRDTALIFCPMPSGRHAAQAYGAADNLVKPITRQALINALLALEKPVHKILIIDDERDVTRMLSRMLAAHDLLYGRQTMAKTALQLCIENNPTLFCSISKCLVWMVSVFCNT